MNTKWQFNGNNYYLEMTDGYLSWNNNNINCDNEPELAICDEGAGKMAILYGVTPEQFENFENFADAIKHATELVNNDENPARPGFWTAWDFNNNKWYY